MSDAAKRLIKAARRAVEFSRILEGIPMEDSPRHTTIVVSKRGKVIGTVHGQRPARFK